MGTEGFLSCPNVRVFRDSDTHVSPDGTGGTSDPTHCVCGTLLASLLGQAGGRVGILPRSVDDPASGISVVA